VCRLACDDGRYGGCDGEDAPRRHQGNTRTLLGASPATPLRPGDHLGEETHEVVLLNLLIFQDAEGPATLRGSGRTLTCNGGDVLCP